MAQYLEEYAGIHVPTEKEIATQLASSNDEEYIRSSISALWNTRFRDENEVQEVERAMRILKLSLAIKRG